MSRIYEMFAVNDTPLTNVYPSGAGASLGQRSAAGSVSSATTQGSSMEGSAAAMAPDADAVQRGGLFGQPLTWWAVIAVLLFGLMFVAKRTGQAGEFGNLKLSAYNILTVTLAAMVGFGAAKALFGMVRVPGLSAFVAAV